MKNEKGGALIRLPQVDSKSWKLEDELHSELDVASAAEGCRHVSGVDFSLISPGKKVGVVEGVVGLKPQLYSLRFRDLEVLEQSTIQIPDARCAECAALAHVGRERRELRRVIHVAEFAGG